jgi:hypothetical protein
VKRKLIVPVGAVALLLLAFLAWKLLFPRTLIQDAEDSYMAAYSGDGGRLYRFVYRDEIEKIGWNEKKLDEFLRRLVVPRMQALGNPEFYDRKLNRNGQIPSQGYVRVRFDRSKAQDFASAMQTDDGGRRSATTLLLRAWFLEYRHLHPDEDDVQQMLRAYLAGYRKDKSELEELGVPGLYDEMSAKVTLWPELEQRWERRASATGPERPVLESKAAREQAQ